MSTKRVPAETPLLQLSLDGDGPRSGQEAADCMACSHTLDDHDATAMRFCNATVERALTRGCICRPNAG